MFKAIICTNRLVSIGNGDRDNKTLNSFCSNSEAIENVSMLILVYNFPTMYRNVLLNLRFKSVVDISFSSNSSKSGVTSCADVVRCNLRPPPSGRIQISFLKSKTYVSISDKEKLSYVRLFSNMYFLMFLPQSCSFDELSTFFFFFRFSFSIFFFI